MADPVGCSSQTEGRRRRAVVSVTGALVVSVAACSSGGFPSSIPPQHPLVMRTPEEVSAPTLDGARAIVPAPDQVTLVNFWSMRCPTCRPFLSKVERLHDEFRQEGVAVIGVVASGSLRPVQDVLQRRKISFPNIHDGEGRGINEAFGIEIMPHTLVFDRSGRVRLALIGIQSGTVNRLRTALKMLLDEPLPRLGAKERLWIAFDPTRRGIAPRSTGRIEPSGG